MRACVDVCVCVSAKGGAVDNAKYFAETYIKHAQKRSLNIICASELTIATVNDVVKMSTFILYTISLHCSVVGLQGEAHCLERPIHWKQILRVSCNPGRRDRSITIFRGKIIFNTKEVSGACGVELKMFIRSSKTSILQMQFLVMTEFVVRLKLDGKKT